MDAEMPEITSGYLSDELSARLDQLAAAADQQRAAVEQQRQFGQRPRDIGESSLNFRQLLGNQLRASAQAVQLRQLPGNRQLLKIKIRQPMGMGRRDDPSSPLPRPNPRNVDTH